MTSVLAELRSLLNFLCYKLEKSWANGNKLVILHVTLPKGWKYTAFPSLTYLDTLLFNSILKHSSSTEHVFKSARGGTTSYSAVLNIDFNLCLVWQERNRFFPNEICSGSIKCYFRLWRKCVCGRIKKIYSWATFFLVFLKQMC